MSQYFLNVNQEERNNILDKHKSLYDGYAVKQNVTNQQPIYIQDLANDKGGLVVNNKGDVKTYTNMGINESIGESKKICSECGLYENVCECGKMEENLYKETGKFPKEQSFDYIEEEDESEMENDFALAVDDETGNDDLGLSLMDTEMEEGFFDYFEDDYDNIDKIFNSDDESFSPVTNIKGEKDTAFSRMKRGHEPEDIDFEEIDDEIKESLKSQRIEILEMFNRFKKYN